MTYPRLTGLLVRPSKQRANGTSTESPTYGRASGWTLSPSVYSGVTRIHPAAIPVTDESNSGLEQTHQGTNVGATGFEPATS